MFNKSEILAAARRAGVRFVRLQFLDLFGILKNVEIPVTELEDALDGRIMFDGSSIQGFVRIEESDMYLRPDLRTWLVFPPAFTDATVARLICNVCLPDGRPFAGIRVRFSNGSSPKLQHPDSTRAGWVWNWSSSC
ncbi:hypothetical protein GCM10025857_12360 [Alicyclobacillus contaminans]|nr:hypothetical protein GCM10025857_12360 [Alicyclobacillus contaminans]